MDYNIEVEKDAYAFLSDIEEDIKEAILNGEEDVSNIRCEISGYGEIQDAFFESVTDRSYTIEDAAFVIANCENEETDTGLWGYKEIGDAMQTCAALSYGNDVWAKVVEVYEGLYDDFEPSYIVVDEDGNRHDGCKEVDFSEEEDAQGYINYDVEPEDREGLEVIEGRGNIDELWHEYEADFIAEPVEVGSTEELQVLRQWVRLAKKAGTWGGYPLGSVYIDSRCGTGYSMPEVKDFYDFDAIARQKVPGMVGKYGDAIKDRIEELEGITGKEWAVTVELEADQWGEIVTNLHEIAGQIADGHKEGHGWKFEHNRSG